MSVLTSKRYYLKKPTGRRKSFSIYLQTVNPDSTTTNVTINNPDIESINQNLNSGKFSIQDALTHAESIRTRLNEQLGAIPDHKSRYSKIGNKHNYKLLDKYWESEYSYRQLSDEDSAYYKLRRAVESIQELSLATASRNELTQKVKNLPYSVRKKRVITGSLNQLLKFIGRDFRLILPKKVKHKIKYLTTDEFETVMQFIENESSEILCKAAFLTGGRQGECFAFKKSDLKGNSLFIQTQLTEDDEEKSPKWDSIRPAYAFDGTAKILDKIEQLRKTDNLPTRNKLRKDFSRACKKAFPDNKDKHCTYHDLRHSYAIRLLSYGVTLDLVAQSLGNSVSVCQEYYAGYVLTHESLVTIDRIVKCSF